MKRYIISKYVNNKFNEGDWTDFSDVGLKFNNKILTMEDYVFIENKYINTIIQILERLKIDKLFIKDYTENNIKLNEKNGAVLTIEEGVNLMVKLLRNQLTHCVFYYPNKFRLSFGFDFYMYISCNIKERNMRNIAEKNNLYVNY